MYSNSVLCVLLLRLVSAFPNPSVVHPLIPRLNPTAVFRPYEPPQRNGQENNTSLFSKRASDQWQPPTGATFLGLNNAQWDQDNTNNAQRIRFRQAWDLANSMAHEASVRLDQLEWEVSSEESHLTTGPNTKARINELRMIVAQLDPAYTQMFAANPLGITTIRDDFRKLELAEDTTANGRNNRHLWITKVENPTQVDPPLPNTCAKDTQAFVVVANNFGPVVDIWNQGAAGAGVPGHDDWILNLCPPFFKMPEMEAQLEVLTNDPNGKKNEICNLANMDTTARVILHEITHLPWMLDTNSVGSAAVKKDYIGFEAAASRSFSGSKSYQDPAFNSFSRKNADTYAWYGVYNFMNSLGDCAGVRWDDDVDFSTGGACTDVWPPGVSKVIRNRWSGWQKSN